MIWVPNGLGSLLAISQLFLYFLFHPVPVRDRVQKTLKHLDVFGGLGLGSKFGVWSGQESGGGKGPGVTAATATATTAGSGSRSTKGELSSREVDVEGVQMGWDDRHVVAPATPGPGPIPVAAPTSTPAPAPTPATAAQEIDRKVSTETSPATSYPSSDTAI